MAMTVIAFQSSRSVLGNLNPSGPARFSLTPLLTKVYVLDLIPRERASVGCGPWGSVPSRSESYLQDSRINCL